MRTVTTALLLPCYLVAGLVFGAIGGVEAAFNDWQKTEKERV